MIYQRFWTAKCLSSNGIGKNLFNLRYRNSIRKERHKTFTASLSPQPFFIIRTCPYAKFITRFHISPLRGWKLATIRAMTDGVNAREEKELSHLAELNSPQEAVVIDSIMITRAPSRCLICSLSTKLDFHREINERLRNIFVNVIGEEKSSLSYVSNITRYGRIAQSTSPKEPVVMVKWSEKFESLIFHGIFSKAFLPMPKLRYKECLWSWTKQSVLLTQTVNSSPSSTTLRCRIKIQASPSSMAHLSHFHNVFSYLSSWADSLLLRANVVA